jgi:DNA-binding MarR family transcriptional regulator
MRLASKRAPTRTEPLPLDLDNYMMALLTWVTQKLSTNASGLYRKLYGVGISEWRIISYLAVRGPGTGAEISEFQGLDKAAISRTIAILRGKSVILAGEPDGRRIVLSLSEKGVVLYNKIVSTALAREDVLLADFTDEERKLAIQLLHRMHKNIPRVVEFGNDLVKQARRRK